MLLQIDATVLYSLQKRKSQVLLIDLQIDSPYNTYKYTSLPPTPISGFGERSMDAILNTPENNYIYYLLTDVNGKMTFTNSYEEFINLKNKAGGFISLVKNPELACCKLLPLSATISQ